MVLGLMLFAAATLCYGLAYRAKSSVPRWTFAGLAALLGLLLVLYTEASLGTRIVPGGDFSGLVLGGAIFLLLKPIEWHTKKERQPRGPGASEHLPGPDRASES